MNTTANSAPSGRSNCLDLGDGKTIEPSLEAVMAYKFDPLIQRMVDKFQWTEEDAVNCFEDLKRFLYLCAINEQSMAPSPKIDEIWHDFILFTADYSAFCKGMTGHFIHHRPRRRDDIPSIRNLGLDTLKLAVATFGTLSNNWEYRRADGSVMSAQDDCGDACEACSPSTNCQDG